MLTNMTSAEKKKHSEEEEAKNSGIVSGWTPEDINLDEIGKQEEEKKSGGGWDEDEILDI